jgi:hypothetical protein
MVCPQKSRCKQVYGMYSRVKKYLKILVKWQIKQKFFKARKGLCRWLDTIWGFVKDHAV